MTDDDDTFIMALHWPVEPLSSAAEARLVAHALAQTQLRPWHEIVANEVERTFSDWRYGMAYKLAAAAACLVLGLGVGVGTHMSSAASDVYGVVSESGASDAGGGS